MVQHKVRLRKGARRRDRGRQLARADQEIVGQVVSEDPLEAAPDIAAIDPRRIGFVMNLMADADQPVAARQAAQPIDRGVELRIGQVDPADDTGNERRLLCNAQELLGLVER